MSPISTPEILREFRKRLVGLPVSHANALLVSRSLLDLLREHVFRVQLEGGQIIGQGDITGARALLDELILRVDDSLRSPANHVQGPALQLQQIGVVPSSRFNSCPDCGHEHLDDKQCNFPIGANRICLCERKVVA